MKFPLGAKLQWIPHDQVWSQKQNTEFTIESQDAFKILEALNHSEAIVVLLKYYSVEWRENFVLRISLHKTPCSFHLMKIRVELPFPCLSGLVRGAFLHEEPMIKSSIFSHIISENGQNRGSEPCLMLRNVNVSSERADTGIRLCLGE